MFCRIHSLILSFPSSLSINAPQRSSNDISEKMALSAPFGAESQRATYYPSATNMQLPSKVGSMLYQMLEIVLSLTEPDPLRPLTLGAPLPRPPHAIMRLLWSQLSRIDVVGECGKWHFIFLSGT